MSLDCLLTFDTTDSMYSVLYEVRRKLVDFVNRLFKEIPDLRIGVIAHGDYNDIYETKTLHFCEEHKKQQLIEFINRVGQTQGFGNGGELYEKVFHEARSFNWAADKRVLITIGDEPAHYKGKLVVSWDKSHIVVYDWKEEVRALRDENNVVVYPIRCLDHSNSRDYHKELAAINEVPVLPLAQFSNIIPVLTAIAFKQQGDEYVEAYGKKLENDGQLDRNTAHIFNLLLNADNLVGGLNFATKNTHFEAVPPWRFQVLHVDTTTDIKSFVIASGATFKKGRGFYELTKAEEVQEQKEVVLRDKRTGDMFTGAYARELIGLPYGQRGKVYPRRNFEYDVFIQSTSSNRKLVPARFLYEVI